MYSKEPRLVKFYKNINAVHTEKVFYGFLSERHKISENEFEYDSWSARFIGKAREKAEELEDGMIIKGKSKLNGGKIKTFKDHRIAMSFSIADLISDSRVMLDDTNCINISFPGYFNLLKDLTK